MNKEDFFKGENVLITGADGFIGSHLTKELLKNGANVNALVHSKEIRNLTSVKDKINIIYGDIKNKECINEIINTDADYIFHLGSLNEQNDNHEDVIETNIIGTINVAEAAVKIKNLKKFIFISTSHIYNESENAIKEDHKINLKSAYSMSKSASEKILHFYNNKENLPITILRLFPIYGPNKHNNVISIFIKSALKNKDISINGDGNQLRDFTYVSDLMEVMLLIAKDEKSEKIINIGSGNPIKVNDLAFKIKELCKSSSKINYINKDPGLKNFYCDTNSLTSKYNWQPKISLEEGLKKNIEWLKEYESTV